MLSEAVLAVFQWSFRILSSLFLTLTGIIIVPVGLLFSRKTSEPIPFTNHPHDTWTRINLPDIFWLWDNIRDGAMGDTRGDYWIGKYTPRWQNKYWKMFWWLAIRNPHNNSDRYLLGYDITRCRVTVAQKGNHVWLKAVNYKGQTCYAYHWLGKFWIGNKIKIEHEGSLYQEKIKTDQGRAYKGFTIRFGGYKI